ncbi:hypothetical protein H8356DRAFT_1323715 [Neocallimastix lanati (nom. inval.)]|nr:hypothetical protein H8356DRAFT_1323715 [Neocallimastix sp. JGI-2020a]
MGIYVLLYCNLSDVYVFAKGASTNLYGLGYNSLFSKEKKILLINTRKKYSEIICMSECLCWIFSKTVQKGTISAYMEVCFYLNIPKAKGGTTRK